MCAKPRVTILGLHTTLFRMIPSMTRKGALQWHFSNYLMAKVTWQNFILRIHLRLSESGSLGQSWGAMFLARVAGEASQWSLGNPCLKLGEVGPCCGGLSLSNTLEMGTEGPGAVRRTDWCQIVHSLWPHELDKMQLWSLQRSGITCLSWHPHPSL